MHHHPPTPPPVRMYVLGGIIPALAAVVVWLWLAQPAAAQEGAQPGLVLPAPGELPALTTGWAEPLAAVVAADGAYLRGPEPYTVTAFDVYRTGADDWALAVIVPAAVVQSGWETLDLDQLVDVLLVRTPDGVVQGHVRAHPEFGALAQAAPRQLIDYGPLLATGALNPDRPAGGAAGSGTPAETIDYRFPWTAGQTWWLGSGWHTGYGPDAVDFSPLTDEDPPVNSAVLAAAGGTLRMACQADDQQRLLWIDHPNGERTGYLHLDRASVAEAVERQGLIGQVVPQGTYLGLVYRGEAKTDGQCPANFPGCTFNTLCGYGSAPHVHFIVPNRGITLDGYSIGALGDGTAGNRFTSTNVRGGITPDTQAPAVWLAAPLSTTAAIAPVEDRLAVTISAVDAPAVSAAAPPSGVKSVAIQFAFEDTGGSWQTSPWSDAAAAGSDTFTASLPVCTAELRVPHNARIRFSLRASDQAGNMAQVDEAGVFRLDFPDVDQDCTVGLRDLVDVEAALAGRLPSPDATPLTYDIDGDGALTPADAAVVLARLQAELPPASGDWSAQAPAASNARADVTTCSAPGARCVVFTPLPAPGSLGLAQGVAVTGTTAYVTDWSGGGLAVLDLATAEPPLPSPGSRLPVGDRTYTVAVGGSRAFVADPRPDGGRIWVLATVQPLTPTVAATITVAGEPLAAVAASTPISDLLFVAAGTGGLQILDTTLPATPTLLAALDTQGSAAAVAVTADPNGRRLALVADRQGGLLVVDVEDAAAPTLLAAFAIPGPALDVAVPAGGGLTAYVAGGLGGVQIVDLADPAHPQLLGRYATAASANSLALDGGVLYVAQGWRGVAALDVTDPARPGLAGSHDTPGYAHALARAGDRLYVADGRGGLRVLQVQVETGPAHAVYAPLAGKEIAP